MKLGCGVAAAGERLWAWPQGLAGDTWLRDGLLGVDVTPGTRRCTFA